MDASLVLAIIGPLAAALATYVMAARGLSGKITTSAAAELWQESRAIREWSADRVTELSERAARLETQVDVLREENERLRKALEEAKAEARQLRQEVEKRVTDVEHQVNGDTHE